MSKNEACFIGIDIGSLTSKAVLIDSSGRILSFAITRSVHDASVSGAKVLDVSLKEANIGRSDICSVIGTGYGRKHVPIASKTLSEVICHARGVNHLFPRARTVIDMGGQDTKVISLDENGAVRQFAMNDKCAAGTGRFLEVMAATLDLELETLGKIAAASPERPKISSFCTVFAESEIIGMLMDGIPKESIAAGLCDAIATRVYGLLIGIPMQEDFIMTGGGAKNEGIVKMLGERIGTRLFTPEEPQITAALGAALIGVDEWRCSSNT